MHSAPQLMEEQQGIMGAIKIKDGLFIGDEYAAQDLEFIVTNKVTHVINCAGSTIGNTWEQIGVMYLTFPWAENDLQNEILNEIVKFIDEAVEVGESTLVHSIKGQSRSCCVLAAYFMKKYNWGLLKTLEFLNSRRPDLEIRASFFQQLTNLERKLQVSKSGAMINNWNDTFTSTGNSPLHVEEIIIRNTFLNSKNAPIAEIFLNDALKNQVLRRDKRDRLTWVDTHHKKDLHIAVYPHLDVFNPLQHYKVSKQSKKVLRSCLKGANKHLRMGSEGLPGQIQQPQKETLSRSMSGKQIGGVGSRNRDGKILGEEINQSQFILNTSLPKQETPTQTAQQQSVSMVKAIQKTDQDKTHQFSMIIPKVSNKQSFTNEFQILPKSTHIYQPQGYIQHQQIQQSNFQMQQPLLSQQIRNIQQQNQTTHTINSSINTPNENINPSEIKLRNQTPTPSVNITNLNKQEGTDSIKSKGEPRGNTLGLQSEQINFQNTLNSTVMSSKQQTCSSVTSPVNTQNIQTFIQDKKINTVGNQGQINPNHMKTIPPQSVSMQENKQNILSKMLEQNQNQNNNLTQSVSTNSSSILRSNSLRAFEDSGSQREETISINKQPLQPKNTQFSFLNAQTSHVNNNNKNELSTNINSTNQSAMTQNAFRSSSLPKKLDEERSPSSKLSSQSISQTTRSAKEKSQVLNQVQKNQFSFLNSEIKNTLSQADKAKIKPNTIRSFTPIQIEQYNTQETRQATNQFFNPNKSPLNSNTKGGLIKHSERPPLKPREQNTMTREYNDTTNNSFANVNGSMNRAYQQPSSIQKCNLSRIGNNNNQSSLTSEPTSNNSLQFQIPMSSMNNNGNGRGMSFLQNNTDSVNKSPISLSKIGQNGKSKPPSSAASNKPSQIYDRSSKENYNGGHQFIVYQPMQNNFFDLQKETESVNPKMTKIVTSMRSFSPDVASQQSRVEKQRQVGVTSKNRIRSNSPGQALTYDFGNNSFITPLVQKEIIVDQTMKNDNIIVSSEADNIFSMNNNLLNGINSSSKPRWKF